MEKKTYNKDGYTIFKYDYRSLEEFLDALIKEKINHNIFPNPKSDSRDYNFYGTRSFQEAWEKCKYTYDDGYKEFSELVKHIGFKLENTQRKIDVYKPVGTSVSVPRYLFGIPDNMRSKLVVYDRPTINMYFQVAYNCGTTKEQIENRGVLTLALINYLENRKKYKVELNFFEMSNCGKEIIYITICLKQKDEKLKIKKCYFPVVHPSFLRRLILRAEEIIPNLKGEWNNGYGSAVNYELALEFLEDKVKNGVYISNPIELGIRGNNIEEDAKSFMENINQKYHFFENETYRRKR